MTPGDVAAMTVDQFTAFELWMADYIDRAERARKARRG